MHDNLLLSSRCVFGINYSSITLPDRESAEFPAENRNHGVAGYAKLALRYLVLNNRSSDTRLNEINNPDGRITFIDEKWFFLIHMKYHKKFCISLFLF